MTREEQLDLVEHLCDNIKKSIMENINDGRIPDVWEGFELRRLIFVRASRLISSSSRRHQKRTRNFNNWVLIENL